MKLKRCPVCGKTNPLSCRICTDNSCGTSLLNAEIIDAEKDNDRDVLPAEDIASDTTDKLTAPSLAMRKCPNCGRILPYKIKKCDCGASMIAVPPLASTPPATQSQDQYYFVLRSEDGKCELKLKDGDDIILGRNAACADYLSTKRFVSGNHARFRVSGRIITIEHIGRTNPTLVNEKIIELNAPYSLNDGDLVSMGAQPGQKISDLIGYFRIFEHHSEGG